MNQQGKVNIGVNVDSVKAESNLQKLANKLSKLGDVTKSLSGIGNSFKRFTKQTEDASKASDKLGDSSGKLIGFITKVAGALLAFEAIKEVGQIFKGLLDNFDDFQAKLKNISGNTGISVKAINGLKTTFTELQTSLEIVGYEILTTLAPLITKFADIFVKGLYKLMDFISPILTKMSNGFSTMFDTLSPIILPLFEQIGSVIVELIDNLGKLGSTMDITNILATIVDLFKRILALVNPIIVAVIAVYQALKPIIDISQVWSKILFNIAEVVVKVIIGGIIVLANWVTSIGTKLTEWFNGFESFKVVVTWVTDKFEYLYNKLIKPMIEGFDKLTGSTTIGSTQFGFAIKPKEEGTKRNNATYTAEEIEAMRKRREENKLKTIGSFAKLGGTLGSLVSRKEDSKGSNADKMSQQVRSLTINIEKQIGIENFVSQSVQAGAAEVERLIKQAMTRAVTDTRFAT